MVGRDWRCLEGDGVIWGKGEETPKAMLSGFKESRISTRAKFHLKVIPSFSFLLSRQNEADSGANLFCVVAAVAGLGDGPGVGAADGRSSPGRQ